MESDSSKGLVLFFMIKQEFNSIEAYWRSEMLYKDLLKYTVSTFLVIVLLPLETTAFGVSLELNRATFSPSAAMMSLLSSGMKNIDLERHCSSLLKRV